MLSTELSTFVAICMVILAAVVAFLAVAQYRTQELARAAVDFVRNQNANSLSLSRMAEVEATLTELLDSYNALLSSHKKLRARIGMRESRQKGKNGVDLSDDAQKTAYKAQLRADLKQKGLL